MRLHILYAVGHFTTNFLIYVYLLLYLSYCQDIANGFN